MQDKDNDYETRMAVIRSQLFQNYFEKSELQFEFQTFVRTIHIYIWCALNYIALTVCSNSNLPAYVYLDKL